MCGLLQSRNVRFWLLGPPLPSVAPVGGGSTLVIQYQQSRDVLVEPANPTSGDCVSLQARVENYGAIQPSAPSKLRFYLGAPALGQRSSSRLARSRTPMLHEACEMTPIRVDLEPRHAGRGGSGLSFAADDTSREAR